MRVFGVVGFRDEGLRALGLLGFRDAFRGFRVFELFFGELCIPPPPPPPLE